MSICRRTSVRAVAPRYGTAVTDAVLISSRDAGAHRWAEAFIRPPGAAP